MLKLVHVFYAESIPIAAATILALAIAVSLTLTALVIWYQERGRRA